MKAKIKIEKEVELTTLLVDAGVRYWEDATVDGVEDEDGSLIPCKNGDRWQPIIKLDTGLITNWTKGLTADIHYKVCDDGIYKLTDIDGNVYLTKDGYVPDIMCPEDNGYGDYIIMKINADGQIANWNPNIEDFKEETEY